MRRLLVIALAACAAFAASPQHASAGTCGISGKGTLWIDFADGSVPFWQTFARPGVIAAASNFIYPPQLRALGAKTIYWDMYLSRRVGSPLEPFDPGLVIQRANRLYDVASMSRDGPQAGSRELRIFFRRKVAEFTSAGISTRKLGLMLGFQTTPGDGGRERASRREWLEVTKLQTLAARQVARELDLRSVWSWGWGVWSKGEDDPDKPAAACVYLWARDPKLCNGPAAAGSGFNASRTEGQLVFPPGARCTLYGRRVADSAISSLAPVTGDRDVAFTAVFERVVASLSATVKAKEVAAAQRAAISNIGGLA